MMPLAMQRRCRGLVNAGGVLAVWLSAFTLVELSPAVVPPRSALAAQAGGQDASAAQLPGRGGGGSGQPQGGGPAGGIRDVVVTAIPGVVATGAEWTLAWQGVDNADGLVGTDDGGLLFAQEQPSRIAKLDRNDRFSVFVQGTRGAGAVSFDARGRLVAAQRTCTDPGWRGAPCTEPAAIGIIYPDAERRVLTEQLNGRPLGRPNDLVVSRSGTIYVTSGGAFRISPDGVVAALGENLRTNGIMLSPDERTLYVTNGATIAAFDVQADGAVRNQRVFAKLEAGGAGDGLAVDAEGRLYVTSMASGVQVFAPDGRYLGVVPTPRSAISAAFSGPEKRTLYIVGSGALDANGVEVSTPPGIRNNAKSIYRIPMIARGFAGRAK
jgi:gluconolactonase